MTYNDSAVLARKLKELSPAILSIELFGSVLRDGHGRDADFMILVNEELAKQWWKEQREAVKVRWPDSLYGRRWIIKKFIPFAYAMSVNKRRHKSLKTAADMLGIQLQSLADPTGSMPDFEMFLVPSAWRAGTELDIEVMRRITDLAGDKNTAGFLQRIARDATKIA